MRKTYLIVLFILWLTSPGRAQMDSLPLRLGGVVYAEDTSQSTPFVHIINYRTGAGVISDSNGFFKTSLRKSDSLIFRCLGFEDKTFRLPDTLDATALFIEIRLSEKTYLLEVVDVYALSRINQFRYDFTQIPLPKDEWEQQMIIPGVTRGRYKWIYENEKPSPQQTFTGPISALYYKWSDEGKSMQKYAELLKNAPDDELINEKFNMALLSEFTGFTGDTLIDFKLYLNFSRRYLLTTDGYHIFLDVKNRLPLFKQEYFNPNSSLEESIETN